jgi:AcrR family transcriptional regulator
VALASTAEPNAQALFFRALDHTQRARMLDAMVWAVAEKGYPTVTVADVVARAGVSRRTFYEHFDDKLDCFLVAYETGAAQVLDEISAELRPLRGADRATRLRIGLGIYLRVLGNEPEFARVLTVDVLGVGPEALDLRERVRGRFARHWRGLGIEDESMLRALVGGIGELVQAEILAGRGADLPSLHATLVRFASAVLAGSEERGETWAA